MTKHQFNSLLTAIKEDVSKDTTNFRDPISAKYFDSRFQVKLLFFTHNLQSDITLYKHWTKLCRVIFIYVAQ